MLNTVFIRARREKLKLTQEQAAKLAGIGGRTHWNRIERGGRQSVRPQTLLALSKTLRCKVDQLLAK